MGNFIFTNLYEMQNILNLKHFADSGIAVGLQFKKGPIKT